MKKILFIWPPNIPFYFNLCYNYYDLIEIASFFSRAGKYEVTVMDCSTMDYSWEKVIHHMIVNRFDVIAVYNNSGLMSSIFKLCYIAKQIKHDTKIITYGRISKIVPEHFQAYSLDAIVYDGDYEPAIEDYLRYTEHDVSIEQLAGIYIKEKDAWIKTGQGKTLNGNWSLADISLIPFESYYHISTKETNIAGFRDSKEMVVSVSRGCPFQCNFCCVGIIEGKRERRKPVSEVINYIKTNFHANHFDLLTLAAPNFTLDQEYVLAFCDQVMDGNLNITWKCVTRPDLLDENLITRMARAGCVRIGLGVETLNTVIQNRVNKAYDNQKVLEIITLCKQHHIIPFCFLMIGLPGQTKADIVHTIKKIELAGGKARIVSYTPTKDLKPDMAVEEIDYFERCYIHNVIQDIDTEEYYRILFDFENWKKENSIGPS